MTYLQARDLLFAILKTWADAQATPAVTVQWPDVVFTKPEGAYLKVKLQHGTGSQASLGGGVGTKLYQRTGTVTACVYAPIARGLRVGYTLAQGLTDSIQAYRNSDVWIRNVRIRELGSEGGYERVQVIFDFEYTDRQ